MNLLTPTLLICALASPLTAPAVENRDASTPKLANPCRVDVVGNRFSLTSPSFVFTLDSTDGLAAVTWENRLTGRTLSLGNGAELELDIGLPNETRLTPKLHVTGKPTIKEGANGEVVFQLAAENPKLSATVRYVWDEKQQLLRKFVSLTNLSGQQWNRLLNVRLGDYKTDSTVLDADPDYPRMLEDEIIDLAGKRRGFPAYVEWQFFVGLAHPAGFATRQGRTLSLRQLPAVILGPGASFECMEAVYGISREGQARQAFREHIQSRMRRVLRGHDKPLAILEEFGAKPRGEFWGPGRFGDFWQTEAYVMDHIAKVAEGQRNSGLHWDYYSLEFWHDWKGDLKTPSKERFPNGFSRMLPELRKLGTKLGLWVDSGNWGDWTISDNPAVEAALTPGRNSGSRKVGLCRATEPANTFYVDGYAHQLRENGVRLVKFDNAQLTCSVSTHSHLTGVDSTGAIEDLPAERRRTPGEPLANDYSTEAIANSLIEFYRGLDRECPEVFIMLYWNYQSPWWLQYADTIFDTGMHMEGASFTTIPTLRARDSVTRRLDQGRWMLKDWPALGWDTLGVWLSDWDWNSHIGKEAWQHHMIMDISRGHLLAQLWSDDAYLSPDERVQMADFIALLKGQPECFRNSRFILGDPWKNEPYGYSCTDGNRAFLAINNGVWQDSSLTLELNSMWGLPGGKRWDVYRCWPNPAKIGEARGSNATLALRPFETVLLEIVPAGESPTLRRKYDLRPMPTTFAEPSRTLEITVERKENLGAAGASELNAAANGTRKVQGPATSTQLIVRGTVPPSMSGGILSFSDSFFQQVKPYWTHECKSGFTVTGTLNGKDIVLEPVINNGLYKAPWQTWRIPLAGSDAPRAFELIISTSLPNEIEHRISAHFIPEQ